MANWTHKRTLGQGPALEGVVDAAPNIAPGLAAPIGSLASLGSTSWAKVGSGDTDWVVTSQVYAPRSRWVSPLPGAENADGTPGNPYNPNSAAAARVALEILADEGEIQQAINAIGEPTTAAEEGIPATVHLLGGEHPEQAIRPLARGRTRLEAHGLVRVGSHLTYGSRLEYAPAGAQLGSSIVRGIDIVSRGAGVAGVLLFGDIEIDDGGAGIGHAIAVQGLTVRDWSSTVGHTGTIQLHADGLTVSGALNLPTAWVLLGERILCTGAWTVDRMRCVARSGRWQDALTVTTAPSYAHQGYYGCEIAGLFTGPAGSARYDKVTQNLSLGGFAGGAGPGDFLE
ncbi:MAG: hypothetical protein PVJ64_00330 [Gemmatimonadales bacterium]|jgi:hypothetical protein